MSKNPFIEDATSTRRNLLVDYTSFDQFQKQKQRAREITASLRQAVPGIPQEGYAGTEQFKDVLMRAISSPESLTAAEKKQIEAAKTNYPEFRQFLDSIEEKRNEKAGPIDKDLKPLATAFYNLGQKLIGGVPVMETKKGVLLNPTLSQVLIDTGLKMVDLAKKSSSEFFDNIIGLKRLTGKNVTQTVSDMFDQIGLRPITKEDGDKPYKVIDRHGRVKELPKMPEVDRVATNLVITAVRFLPELLTSFVENPVGFQIGVGEFFANETNILLNTVFHRNIEIDAGEVSLDTSTDEEVQDAIETLKQNPLGPVILGLAAVGAVEKGRAKYVSVRTDRLAKAAEEAANMADALERLDQIRKQAESPARQSAAVFERLLPEREAAQRAVEESARNLRQSLLGAEKLKKDLSKRQAKIEATGDAVVDRIKKTSTPALATELLQLQSGAKEPLTVSQIAGMSRNELEYRVSGGRIPLEKQAEKTVPKPEEQKTAVQAEKQPAEEQKATTQAEKQPPVKAEVSAKEPAKQVEVPLPEEPKQAEVPLSEEPKHVKALRTQIADTEKALEDVERSLPEADKKTTQILQAMKANLENTLQNDKARLEELRAEQPPEKAPVKPQKEKPVKKQEAQPQKEKPKEEVAAKAQKPVEGIDQAPKIETGNENADLLRNIAHHKKAIATNEKFLERSDVPKVILEGKEGREGVIALQERLRKELHAYEAELERRRNEAEEQITKKAEQIEPEPEKKPETEKKFSVEDLGIETVPLASIHLDEPRFQGRKFEKVDEQKKFRERVDAIKKEFDYGKVQIVIWRDPKDGKDYVIGGHHTVTAMKELQAEGKIGPDAPVRRFKGTEQEAIDEAKIFNNRRARPEDILSSIDAYRRAKERGMSEEKIADTFMKERVPTLEAYSHLSPGGRFRTVLEQDNLSNYPFVERWAKNVGDLRAKFPQLTGHHEDQIFNQLYPTSGKAAGFYNKLTKPELFDLVEAQITAEGWKPGNPIKLRKDTRPQSGARANPNEAVRKAQLLIDEKEDLMKKNAELIDDPVQLEQTNKTIQAEIDKLREQIRGAMAAQSTFFSMMEGTTELGSLGTPEAYKAAIMTGYQGAKYVSQYIGEIIKRAQQDPVVGAGVRTALEAMKDHHRNILDADIAAEMLAKEFAKLIPDPARQKIIAHAVEQGKKSKWWKELTPKEEGAATWIARESERWEQFVKDNDIMDLPERKPGQHYLMHWWIDPKTGRPYPVHYGKFAKIAPQFFERGEMTIEQGEKAGKKLATPNAGMLLGQAIRGVIRAHETRQLVKTLDAIESEPGLNIRIFRKNKKGEEKETIKQAKMVEGWRAIQYNGLEGLYTKLKVQSNVLKRPIHLKDGRVIQGEVGIYKDLHPFVEAYINTPTYGRMAKLMFAAKTWKLTGLFHPVSLAKQAIAQGENPLGLIIRGKRYIERMDETMRLLRRNGLSYGKYEPFGLAEKTNRRIFKEKTPLSYAEKGAMIGPELVQKFVFEVVHDRLVSAYAVETFTKQWPRLQAKGLTKDQAARLVVRQAYEIFSGDDYKFSLLESSAFSAKYVYGATARKVTQLGMLSPTWQLSHWKMFIESIQSTLPEATVARLRNMTPKQFRRYVADTKSPIANKYRQYVAGALSLYAVWNMVNWISTKQLDGTGKLMVQNEEGKKFRVRMPFNHPDGSPVYINPLKSIFEVPEQIAALNPFNPDFQKFLSKVHPVIEQTARQMFNIDDFGRQRYDELTKPNAVRRAIDLGKDIFLPITVETILNDMDYHKSRIGTVISLLAFPVSKGHRGGDWDKKLEDYKHHKAKDRAEAIKIAKDLVIKGKATEALITLYDNKISTKAFTNIVKENRTPLMNEWMGKGMTAVDRYMFLLALDEDERQKFLQALNRETIQSAKK